MFNSYFNSSFVNSYYEMKALDPDSHTTWRIYFYPFSNGRFYLYRYVDGKSTSHISFPTFSHLVSHVADLLDSDFYIATPPFPHHLSVTTLNKYQFSHLAGYVLRHWDTRLPRSHPFLSRSVVSRLFAGTRFSLVSASIYLASCGISIDDLILRMNRVVQTGDYHVRQFYLAD